MSPLLSRSLAGLVAVAFPAAAAVTGCGSDDPAPAAAGAGNDTGGAIGDEQCKDESAQSTCLECCANAHITGYLIYDSTALACFCGDEGACQEPCAGSLCAAQSQNPDAACRACMNGASQCQQQIDEACARDADCTLLLRCNDTCPTN